MAEREHWNIPLSADFAKELRELMAAEGFESKSEFARVAFREKLERSARRRLEAALLEGIESGVSDESTEDFFARLRRIARGEETLDGGS